MKKLKFTAELADARTRLDKFITLNLGEEYSRNYVKFLIENGFVHLAGKEMKPSYLLRKGDEISLELVPLEEPKLAEPENIPLDILYEDKSLLIVNKPAGMVVHPASGNRTGTFVNALLYHCKNLADTGNGLRPGIVHRLDKDTTGVIAAVKNERALRSLAKQFQNRAVKKNYIAIVQGCIEMDNGVIDAPVARHRSCRKKMDVEYEKGKSAKTIYHVIRRFKGATLLRVELLTGRTHQIRVHMKHIGHPILGDATYGKSSVAARQALHAELLGFTHPDTDKYVEFKAPIPDDMRRVIDALENKPGR
ncbi:MAG: RluA family pseudouridine synthase [Candidatus Omnitrophota bacterium]